MKGLVFDASALLAVIFDERGAERATEFLALTRVRDMGVRYLIPTSEFFNKWVSRTLPYFDTLISPRGDLQVHGACWRFQQLTDPCPAGTTLIHPVEPMPPWT